MGKLLVSKAELARRAGVSEAAINKACKVILKSAVDGKRLNINHPDVVQYLKRHDAPPPVIATASTPAPAIVPPPPPPNIPGIASEQAKRKHDPAKAKKKASAPADDQIYEIPDDILKFAEMSLRELVQRFGTDIRFCDWLKATQTIEAINEKRLKNAATKGELVSRHLVKIGIIDPVDQALNQLLSDGVKTIARRVTAMHDAGRPLDDVEKFVSDQISSFIRPMKAKVKRTLTNVES